MPTLQKSFIIALFFTFTYSSGNKVTVKDIWNYMHDSWPTSKKVGLEKKLERYAPASLEMTKPLAKKLLNEIK